MAPGVALRVGGGSCITARVALPSSTSTPRRRTVARKALTASAGRQPGQTWMPTLLLKLIVLVPSDKRRTEADRTSAKGIARILIPPEVRTSTCCASAFKIPPSQYTVRSSCTAAAAIGGVGAGAGGGIEVSGGDADGGATGVIPLGIGTHSVPSHHCMPSGLRTTPAGGIRGIRCQVAPSHHIVPSGLLMAPSGGSRMLWVSMSKVTTEPMRPAFRGSAHAPEASRHLLLRRVVLGEAAVCAETGGCIWQGLD